MLKAKYRLHADKVDRLAIVDRPCVPNAQIVLFKRKQGEKAFTNAQLIPKALDFGQEFMFQGTEGACIALENTFWSTLFDDQLTKEQKLTAIDTMFSKFVEALSHVMMVKGLAGVIGKQEGPTPEEVSQSFMNSITMSAISNGFQMFRGHLGFFIMNGSQIENAEGIVKQLIDTMRAYVKEQLVAIVEKKLTVEQPIAIDKEGRIISASRLQRLKQALSVLAEIIEEADQPKEKKEAQMDLQELIKKFEELGGVVEGLKTAIADLSKKLEGEPEYVKAFKARLEAIEKKVGAGENIVITDALEANRAKIEDIIRGSETEKATIKAEKEELVKRIEKAEGLLAQILKGYDSIAKRMGQSKGLTIEKNDDTNTDGKTAFDNALKAGRKDEKK